MLEDVPRTKFKMPITSRSHLSTANNTHSTVHELWGTVVFRAVILAGGRVTRSSVGERCDIVFIMFLF